MGKWVGSVQTAVTPMYAAAIRRGSAMKAGKSEANADRSQRPSHLRNIICLQFDQVARAVDRRGELESEIFERIRAVIPGSHSQRSFVDMLVGHVFKECLRLIAAGALPWFYVELRAILRTSFAAYLSKHPAIRRPDHGVAKEELMHLELAEMLPYLSLTAMAPSALERLRHIDVIATAVTNRDFETLEKLVGGGEGIFSTWREISFTSESAIADFVMALEASVAVCKPHKRRYFGRRDTAS